ncbi:hypothetical protein KBB49_01705 [Candidatus Saccharibacteria bacterium]|nr:hypothetical protein [Candidatus Saccharibacteria bacterium]
MNSKFNKHFRKLNYFIALGVTIFPVKVFAQTPSSTNYQVPESSFTTGSNIDANSASYNSRVSFGDLAIGSASSTSYNARPGSVTPDEEFLELVVQTANVNLGALLESTTGSGTAIFYVRSYINGDYYVQSSGSTLTSGSDTITALGTPTASTTGTEQFGINVVANATPAVGADPAADPSTFFANGIAETGYDTADFFQFNSGDVIARSGPAGPAWGRTNYTVSYIANVTSITEAGNYTMNHDIIVTATF